MSDKRCAKCREFKPVDDFYRNAAARDGRQSYCKPCQDDYVKASVAKARMRRRPW